MNNFIRKILTLVFLIISSFAYSQNTIGLIKHNINTSEGYTLFSPERHFSVYLINNCGEVVNEWEFTETPGLTCYLLDNGNLLRAGKDSLQIRDWNNNIIWTYAMNANGLLQHHDIEPLPNGNILCVVTDRYNSAEIIAQGRDSNKFYSTFKLDKIVELQPTGINDANIVWEWKFIDHIVQDFDKNKPNFGVIMEHPELVDINFDNGYDLDYTHVNAIDYNASLDQILLSTRHLNELHIIDHSTTTAQASGHSGGNSGMGGDILWRWGNPAVYDQGTVIDQKLFKQHDAKWVQKGYLDFGKISVFNNEGTSAGKNSYIHLIEPELTNNIYTKGKGKFNPLNFDWSWNGSILGTLVFQDKKSGVQSLPNGNMLICETSLGQISEITKSGEHVWTYVNAKGASGMNQFDTPSFNTIFRAEKYPSNFTGFTDKDLTSKGIIENQNDVSANCILTSEVKEVFNENTAIVNPITNGVVEFVYNVMFKTIIITNTKGQQVYYQTNFSGTNLKIDLNTGLYFIQLINGGNREVFKVFVD